MAATIINNKVYFVDHDRMIDGHFELYVHHSRLDMQAAVMAAYDHNLYRHGTPAGLEEPWTLRQQLESAAASQP